MKENLWPGSASIEGPDGPDDPALTLYEVPMLLYVLMKKQIQINFRHL